MSTLLTLSDIIASGVARIESTCTANGRTYPSLNDPYSSHTTAVQNLCAADAAPVIAAAYQLIATLSPADSYLFNCGTSVSSALLSLLVPSLQSFQQCYLSSSIAVIGEGCVPDILREAGSPVSDSMCVEGLIDKYTPPGTSCQEYCYQDKRGFPQTW